MGIKSNYRIKTPTEVEFLKGFGSEPGDFVKVGRRGGIFDILRAFGSEFTFDLAKKLNDLNNIDQGKLIESMTFRLKRFGKDYTFEFRLNEYYKYLDKGRKPGGKLPFEYHRQGGVIYEWVKRNNYFIEDGISRKTGKPFKAPKGHVNNQIALAAIIGRKIKKFGRKGNKFFTSTVKDGRIKELNADLSKALKTEVTIDIKEFVKELKKT